MMARPYVLALGTLAIVTGGACSSSSGTSASSSTGTQALWVAPASLDQLSDVHFYDHPWPSDLRRDPDGTIHVAGFYNPHVVPLLDTYISETKGLLPGFSPTAAMYLRFTGDIDPSTLPADPPHSLMASSSVQLVNVDPKSPEHGKRHLLETFWQKADGVYWLGDTLAVRPALGYPLLPKTKYALVVTTALHAADGTAITPSSDLAEVLGSKSVESRVQTAHDLYAPTVADLATQGIAASAIVHLAVFTTNDPTADLFAVMDDVHASVPAPTVDATTWAPKEQQAGYDVYEGYYGPSPNYQQGTPPYSSTGGSFVFTNGKPVLQNTFKQNFCLVVPNAQKCPMPAAGYPIVLYAHGTGGDYRSIVDEGNSFGDLLAQHCMASMGINQIFSGNRPGSPGESDPNYEGDEDLLFFNVNNLLAARTNGRQGAVDVVQQARLFTETKMTVPATVSRTQATISFDATKLVFVGHSEGGLNGPLFLAGDSQALGGVLSGSGAMITVALLEKTSPMPSVASAVKTLLELTTASEAAELNLFHPVLNMAQAIVDATDPVNYARYIFQAPRAGFAPKSILQTEGVNADGTGDTYAPPLGIEIHSVALGLPRETPGVHTIAQAAWGGLSDITVPSGGLQGNLAGGKASGVLGQFVPAPMDDGHFVAFDVPAAHAQVGQFCQNLAADPKGLVPALQ
ncbi:MAG TPA: hypothetical protein VF765_30105 [Polyangiaceae bacterium]